MKQLFSCYLFLFSLCSKSKKVYIALILLSSLFASLSQLVLISVLLPRITSSFTASTLPNTYQTFLTISIIVFLLCLELFSLRINVFAAQKITLDFGTCVFKDRMTQIESVPSASSHDEDISYVSVFINQITQLYVFPGLTSIASLGSIVTIFISLAVASFILSFSLVTFISCVYFIFFLFMGATIRRNGLNIKLFQSDSIGLAKAFLLNKESIFINKSIDYCTATYNKFLAKQRRLQSDNIFLVGIPKPSILYLLLLFIYSLSVSLSGLFRSVDPSQLVILSIGSLKLVPYFQQIYSFFQGYNRVQPLLSTFGHNYGYQSSQNSLSNQISSSHYGLNQHHSNPIFASIHLRFLNDSFLLFDTTKLTLTPSINAPHAMQDKATLSADDLNFTPSIPENLLVLTGKSGVGKSTLLRQVALQHTSSPSFDYLDLPLKFTGVEKIIYESQFPVVVPCLSIFQNIFLYENQHLSSKQYQKKIDFDHIYELFDFLDLPFSQISREDLQYTPISSFGKLSGGQSKRLGLLRTYLSKSPVKFFDEPTTGLDSLNESRVRQLLENDSSFWFVISHSSIFLDSSLPVLFLNNASS